MRLHVFVLASAMGFSASTQAFECKTVMGGCPKDTTPVTAAHMHSPVMTTSNQSIAVSASTNVKTERDLGSKKNNSNLIQTINKTIVK